MITTDELLQIFSEKLLKTGSFDDAFKKSHWIAFKEGVKEGSKRADELMKEIERE